MIIHLFILSSAVEMYEFSHIHFHQRDLESRFQTGNRQLGENSANAKLLNFTMKLRTAMGKSKCGATCTVCYVLHGWSRGQKNEQQNNAPNPKKQQQCICRLSGV